MRTVLAATLCLFVGCGSDPPGPTPDGDVPDVMADAAPDAPTDAPGDGVMDGMWDPGLDDEVGSDGDSGPDDAPTEDLAGDDGKPNLPPGDVPEDEEGPDVAPLDAQGDSQDIGPIPSCVPGSGICKDAQTLLVCDETGQNEEESPCPAQGGCVDGACVTYCGGEPCDDGDPCTTDACDFDLDACVTGPVDPGTSCDDGDACTGDGVCVEGTCVGGEAATVCEQPEDPTCGPFACNPATGGCEITPGNEGTPCDDGDPCTYEDQCVAGTCAGFAEPAICDPGEAACDREVAGTCNGCGSGLEDGTDCDGASGSLCRLGVCEPVGATWWVSKSGDDSSGDGSAGDPLATIQKAIDDASPGDAIRVEPGTYQEHLVITDKWLDVASTEGALVTVVDAGLSGKGLHVHGEGSAGTRFSGFTITGGKPQKGQDRGGGAQVDASHSRIVDCILTANSAAPDLNLAGGAHLKIGGSFVRIERTRFVGALTYPELWIDDGARGVLFENCAITTADGATTVLAGNGAASLVHTTVVGSIGPVIDYLNDSETENLVSGCVLVAADAGSGTGALVWYDGSLGSWGSTVRVQASRLWGTQASQTNMFQGVLIVGPGNITGDPLFAGLDDGAYSLSDASPCVGAATGYGAPPSDITGAPRPQGAGTGPDMGAWESAK